MNKITTQKVIEHYERAYGRHAYEAYWRKGPVDKLPSSFRVLVFEPNSSRQLWVYATCGMSEQSSDAPIELHMFSPSEFCGHTELLTVVAHYHLSGHPLDVAGSTVNFGREWMPGSNLTYGLVSLPYRDGPNIEYLNDKDGSILARCYWLLPITQDEREYKKRHGLEKLEELFDTYKLEYANPFRKSVVEDVS